MESLTFTKAGLELEIRPLKTEDIDQVFELVLSVGWTFGIIEVLQDIHRAFPRAMWGAFDKDNTLISTCSFFPVDDTTVYFTYFITSPQYQNGGIGKHLYQEVLQHLNTPNVLLLAFPKTFPIYEKWGYKQSKHYLRTFKGKLTVPTGTQHNKNYHVEPMDQHLEKVVRFEKDNVSGVERCKTFQMMLTTNQLIFARCAFLDGEICGFIIIVKDCDEGIKTSAFQARDFETATALLSHVAREISHDDALKEKAFMAKFPAINYDTCAKLYSMFGLEEITEHLHGLYYGKDIEAKWEKVYAVLNYSVAFL